MSLDRDTPQPLGSSASVTSLDKNVFSKAAARREWEGWGGERERPSPQSSCTLLQKHREQFSRFETHPNLSNKHIPTLLAEQMIRANEICRFG